MFSPETASKKQRVGIMLDLGNSETRVRVKYKPIKGLEGTHEPVDMTFELSNHYVALLSDYVVSPDYMNSRSSILSINEMRIANGELVEREFIGSYSYPSGKNDKSSEPITNWTIQLVIAKTYHLLSEAWDIPISDIDISFDILCLLPPDEHAYNKQAMIDLIAGIDTVTELVPVGDEENYTTAEYPVLCNMIQCYPEGITAFFGMCVDISGNKATPNPDIEKYRKGYVLIIDIGAGTTDLAIMQDGMLKADSRMSIPDAGNHIISALTRNLKATKLRGRLQLGIKNVASIMEQGTVSEGDGVIVEDCAEQLTAAKEELAEALSHQIANWANSNSVVSLAKGILIVGGANVAAIREGKIVSPAIDTFLMPKLKTFCPYAELISLRNRDPRYLNLDGLESVYLTYLAKRGASK